MDIVQGEFEWKGGGQRAELKEGAGEKGLGT